MGDLPPWEGVGAGIIRRGGDRFQLIVPSLPMNKLAKQDLDILIVIFVALRLRGTPGVMDG